MKHFKNILISTLVVGFISVSAAPLALFASSPASVNLGSAGNFTILSKTGISTTGSTHITGDIGVSPISASAITGFALTLPAASAFSTSALVTGKVYASDYAVPTPTTMTTAIGDMQIAFTDAMGRAANVTELGAGNIGGLTIAPGVYKWGTGVTIPTDVTLSGNANDVWIFQIAQTLTVSSSTHIVLSGGAQASNIFWAVSGQTTIGTTAVFNGNILDQTAIVLNTGATLNGRALAQTAVTLDSNAVAIPNYVAPVVVVPVSTNTNSGSNNSSSNNSNNSSIITTNPNSVICSTGDIFSATTGQRCTTFFDPVVCPLGQLFSATNGARCTSFTNSYSSTGNPSYDFGTILVQQGTMGTECNAWQRFFNDKAGANLSIDGNCGPLTMAFAKSWQSSNGLVVDGLLGPLSRVEANTQS